MTSSPAVPGDEDDDWVATRRPLFAFDMNDFDGTIPVLRRRDA